MITKTFSKNIERLNAFISETTGAGIPGIDKFASYSFSRRETLDPGTLESLYSDNDIAATIVERIVKDALREGYGLAWQGADDTIVRRTVDWAEARYEVTQVLQQARIYSRLFGGGAVFIGADDDRELDQAVEPGFPVEFLRAHSSEDLRPRAWYADVAQQNFHKVALYDLSLPTFAQAQTRATKQGVSRIVDHSRLVTLDGVRTTDKRFRERGWGESVLRRVYDVLLKFEASFASIQHSLAESSIPVYKVEGLMNLLASENWEPLQDRFQLINTSKSNYQAIVLDKDETFERVAAQLQEAANVVEAAMLRVAGAAGMPATILFGRSPAGLNATGQSDLEVWHGAVAQEQSLVLAPAIRELYTFLLAQEGSPTGGVIPEGLKVTFPSLWTPLT
ncbi:MAG: DUF1073 domain-containing protein [Polyangiales bacterium]